MILSVLNDQKLMIVVYQVSLGFQDSIEEPIHISERRILVQLVRWYLTFYNEEKGAPYEWRSSDDIKVDGGLYGASAALPYVALK